MSGFGSPGESNEQNPESVGNASNVVAAIRSTISNITAASSSVADAHFQLTRRRAGFGVGATTAWALANAIWKLSTPAFNATAMALSSYSDAATTVGMAATSGALGMAADISTCFGKRNEIRDSLNKFISFMQEAQSLDLIGSIKYKNSLTSAAITLDEESNIEEAWKTCAEMEIILRDRPEPIKLTNVDNFGSKYMILHSVAALASISIFAANLGITGNGLHEIVTRPDNTTDITPIVTASTASSIAALGTVPYMTFVNWLTTLWLQQEKQMAGAITFLLEQRPFYGNPVGHEQLINLLVKFEVYTAAQLVSRSLDQQSEETSPEHQPPLAAEEEKEDVPFRPRDEMARSELRTTIGDRLLAVQKGYEALPIEAERSPVHMFTKGWHSEPIRRDRDFEIGLGNEDRPLTSASAPPELRDSHKKLEKRL